MFCRTAKGMFLLFCLLIFGSTGWSKSIETKRAEYKETEETVEVEEKKVVELSFTVTPTPDGFSLHLASTSPSLITPTNQPSTALSVSDGKRSSNATGEFKPSVHFGVIDEPSIRTSPFNDLHHMQFENSVKPESYRELHQAFKTAPHSSVSSVESLLKNSEQNNYRTTPGNIPAIIKQIEDEEKRASRVKFQDEGHVVYRDIQKNDDLSVQPMLESSWPNYDVIDQQQVFQNVEKPVHEYETGVFVGKPTKFQENEQKFDLSSSPNFGTSGSQYYGLQQSYNNYQPAVFQQYETIKKPDDVVYIHQQESSFTRTRKYPFSYYQPPLGYQEFDFLNNMHSVTPYPRRRRIPPWKKLIHLIGAFLPLGLLLATLTPNVVKIENTTQPNIVLSKLRVADLPVEHKQSRLLEDSANLCEERSICELIVAEGKTDPNVLLSVLWNFMTRLSERTGREKELESVFQAVRRKDCSRVVC